MRKIGNQKRANLRDVAKAAGVSVATVSRVLNSPDSVAPETRAKVQSTISELRFMPSAAARAINSGRTRFVGALVPTLDNAIFASFLSALENKLNDYGLALIVSTIGEDPQLEVQKAQSLINLGAEALILSGAAHDPKLFQLTNQTRFPTLATSFYDDSAPLPTIGYDNHDAAQLGVQYLKSAGHRHIAVAHGPVETNDRTQARINGVQSVSGMTIDYHEADISFEGAQVIARNILAQKDRPTAVACMSDVLAIGLLQQFQRSHLRVPEDISVLGMDDLPFAAHTFPALSTIHLPVKRMGTAAGRAIGEWLEHGNEPAPERLEPQLILRESVAEI